MIQFDCVTLFPQMFGAVAEHGITRRAYELGLWSLTAWNPRDFTSDAHRTVDDRPYGGGPGMVMMAEPLAQAVAAAKAGGGAARVLALAPNGAPLTDARVRALASAGGSLALVCGRYEGIDQRFLDASRAVMALKRLGTADEVSEGVVFLASSRARWITGQTLMIDGGYAL